MITRLENLLQWAAVWAFLTGLGTFLDKYYIGPGPQDRVRTKLISLYLSIDGAWKRFLGGSLAEVKVGKKGRIAQALLGLGWLAAIAWWADRRARRSSATIGLNRSYLGPFTVGAAQGLLGGLIASILLVVFASLLFASLMLALHYVTLFVIGVLNKASDPKNSPFGYFGSLLGLTVVAVKLTYAFLVPSSGAPSPPIK
jgi:hypothetical protein